MDLELDTMLALARECAPSVAPATLVAVAHAESRFNPLAIGVNGPSPRSLKPTTAAEATRLAERLIAEGRSIDLGLGQINSGNLSWLGLSVADAFDPCTNMAASARVLAAGYQPADSSAQAQQFALRVAFSRYNTGDAERGFRNGYVARVERSAAEIAPRLPPDANVSSGMAAEVALAGTEVAAVHLVAELEAPRWDVFGRARQSDVFVFPISQRASPQ